MILQNLYAISVSLTVLFAASTLRAQQVPPPGERVEQLTIQRRVQAAFQVTPLVHRVESQRGKLLQFSYEVTAGEKPMRLFVQPVALRQEETGVVLPADNDPPPEALRLLTAKQLDLDRGEKHEIRCQVTVPFSESNFHSFGIIVFDTGQTESEPNRPENDGSETRANIRFVTRYLCRVDITVLGVRGESIQDLILEDAQLIDTGGRPEARVYVSNPTDTPHQFQVQCRLVNPGTGSGRRPFHLVMPVRASLDEPDRFTAKIIGNSRVRLNEPVPHPVFPGHYELEVQLLSNFRTVKTERFPVLVEDGQFPAQAASIVQVSPGVTVGPAQIELSFASGGNRLLPLTISSVADRPVTLSFRALAGDKSTSQYVRVRPDRVTIDPGRSRRILLSVNSSGGTPLAHHYGTIQVLDESSGNATTTDLLTAVIGRGSGRPLLEVGEMNWDVSQHSPILVIPVANTGERHLPLNGELILAREDGPTMRVSAGHDRWLLPGASSVLQFRLPEIPEAGVYQLALRIDSGDDEQPYLNTQVIELSH